MGKSKSTFSISFGKPKKHYGFFHLLFDLVMTLLTGGLWLLWLLIKFLRNS